MMLGHELGRFECKGNPRSSGQVPLAFGARCLPALVEYLDTDNQNNSVIILSLQKLEEKLRLSREASAALRSTDIVPRLTKLTAHRETVIRIQALSCLAHLASTFEGKEQIREHETLNALVPQFRLIEERRFKAGIFELLKSVSSSQPGAKIVVESGFISALAQQLRRGFEGSVDSLSSAAAVYRLCGANCPNKQGLEAIFEQHIVGAVVPLLTHHDLNVRTEVAQFLESITFHEEGRNQALGQETCIVEILCGVLSDKNAGVRARAAGALANVCTGPVEMTLASKANGLQRLLDMLYVSNDTPELICALRSVTALIALPTLRAQCRNKRTVATITQLTENEDSELLRETAKITLKEIHWTP